MLKSMIVLIPLLLAGCASVDYALPPETLSAPLVVSTNMEKVKNIKVRYQGVNTCATYPGKLMGVINSVTIGIKGGNPIEVSIPAGNIQVVSVMGSVPLDVGVFDVLFQSQRDKVANDYAASLRESYFAFEPKERHRYFLQFDLSGSDIKLIGYEQTPTGEKLAIDSLPLPNNCKNNPIHNI